MDDIRKKYERGLQTNKPFKDQVLYADVHVRAHKPLSAQQFAEQVLPREYSNTWTGVQKVRRAADPEKFNALVESIRKEGVREPVQVSAGLHPIHKKPFLYNGHHRVAAALEAGAEIPYVRVANPKKDPFFYTDPMSIHIEE